MAKSLPVGPYRTLTGPDAVDLPYYILPFDERGFCSGPRTLGHILGQANSGDYTDIFVFSHGWNTDWKHAISGYETFIRGFGELRQKQGLSRSEQYRPLLIGVFWPSVTLVLPYERAPKFAGTSDAAPVAPEADGLVAHEQTEVEMLARTLPGNQVARFYQLLQAENSVWNESCARELATILHGVYSRFNLDDLDANFAPPNADALFEDWAAGAVEDEIDPGPGPATIVGGRKDSTPQAAGRISAIPTPRDILRATTVRSMKDRATIIGRNGVGPLLKELLAGKGRVRLIGHSYGCQVLLSAVCSGSVSVGRKIESALLLQPAISSWCFAPQIHQTGRLGGYRSSLQLIRQPILATFSKRDAPLHDYYHRALTRQRDAGERDPAPAAETAPYFAALGGYGPKGLSKVESHVMTILLPSHRYQLNSKGLRVLGINGEKCISGHSDVCNEAIYWALFNQLQDSDVPL